MRKQYLALMITAALSLAGMSALAAPESPPPAAQAQADAGTGLAAADAPEQATAGATGEQQPAQDLSQSPTPAEEAAPDRVGSLSFQNLERRLRENNLTVLALEENIQAIQVVDYDKMYEDIRKSLNQTAELQWQLLSLPGVGQVMASSLQEQYDALHETFEDLKEGKVQRQAADAVWQLRDAQNQVVMGAETLYFTLKNQEVNLAGLDQTIAALDRTLEEVELRHELGQVSSQTVAQTRASRTAAVSGRETLAMNLRLLRTQLEQMIGAEMTGQLSLEALPAVSDGELEAMDLEADLEAARQASYSLRAAQVTLDDAYEQYREERGYLAETTNNYEHQAAAHTYQAAQYNYNATVQAFELSFRELYAQVKDCKQVLDAARTALAVEQDNCAAAQLKAEQGNLSANGLLEAQDKVEQARQAVETAANNLFTAYRSYRWAVDAGILI